MHSHNLFYIASYIISFYFFNISYIPETLAARGKVKLSAKQLGGMIGEVYVIRHDVNLHSEILDTPDFFWKEAASVEDEYK